MLEEEARFIKWMSGQRAFRWSVTWGVRKEFENYPKRYMFHIGTCSSKFLVGLWLLLIGVLNPFFLEKIHNIISKNSFNIIFEYKGIYKWWQEVAQTYIYAYNFVNNHRNRNQIINRQSIDLRLTKKN